MANTTLVGQNYNRAADITIGVTLLTMSIFSLCGNGCVIYVLSNKIKRRVNYLTTFVLLQLAITDSLCVIPFSFIGVCLLYGRDLPPDASLSIVVIENIIGWLGNAMPLTSIYLVTILSFGRCIAIYRSFDYPFVMSHRNVYIMCGTAWFIATVLSSMPYFGGNHYSYDPHLAFMFVSLTKTFPNFTHLEMDVLVFFINIVGVILPALFMISCCLAVIIRLRRKSRETGSFYDGSLNEARAREKSDEATSHAATTVMLITLMFIVCYGPFFVFVAVDMMGRFSIVPRGWLTDSLGMVNTVYVITVVHFVLVALNSCINPCIYYLRAKKFRHDIAIAVKTNISTFATSIYRISSFRSQGSNYSRSPGLSPAPQRATSLRVGYKPFHVSQYEETQQSYVGHKNDIEMLNMQEKECN